MIAIGCAAFVWLGGSRGLAQHDSRREAARQHFAQGSAFYADDRFDAALAEFEAAFRIQPHPAVLHNIALCYEQLHRFERAIATYERYLRAARDEPAEVRAAASSRLAVLRRVVAELVFDTGGLRGEVWVDGWHAGTAPGSVRVSAGRRRVEIRRSGAPPLTFQVIVAGQERRHLELDLSDEIVRPGFVGWGVAVGGLATSVGAWLFLARAQLAANDFAAALPGDPDFIARQEQMDDASWPVVTLGVGAGVLLTAAVPFWIPRTRSAPWWTWAVGATGVGLITAGVLVAAPTPDCVDSGCTRRRPRFHLPLLLWAHAAPLVTIPLVSALKVRGAPAISLAATSRRVSVVVGWRI